MQRVTIATTTATRGSITAAATMSLMNKNVRHLTRALTTIATPMARTMTATYNGVSGMGMGMASTPSMHRSSLATQGVTAMMSSSLYRHHHTRSHTYGSNGNGIMGSKCMMNMWRLSSNIGACHDNSRRLSSVASSTKDNSDHITKSSIDDASPTTSSSSSIVAPSATLSDWQALTKLRLSATSAITGLVTYATNDIATVEGCGILFCGMLLHAMCANIVNEVKEQKFDALMLRTKNRPLVTGAISTSQANIAAGTLLAGGTAILYAGGGWLPTLLSLGTVGLYTHVYTPLKRRSVWNTEVGALVGAGPPLIGWAYADASFLLPEPWLMAAFLAAWQMPHFMLIAIRYRDDYAKGGYMMRSLDDPSGRRCYNYGAFWFFITWVILWWTYATDVTSIMAPVAGSAPFLYTIAKAHEYRDKAGLLRAKVPYYRVLIPIFGILLFPLTMCWLFHQHPNQEWVKNLREAGDSLCVWHGPTRVMETVFDRTSRSVTQFVTSFARPSSSPSSSSPKN